MNHTPYRAVTKGFENPAQIVNRKGKTIAVIYSDAEGGDQYDTAPLFAAAPDLLAACLLARENLSPVYSTDHLLMRMLNDAINKSTGE